MHDIPATSVGKPRVACIVGTVLTALGPMTACGGDDPGRIPAPADIVEVSIVHPTVTDGAVAFPATVQSVDRAQLATRASGMVVRVPVDVGSRVDRGDVVLVLDDDDVTARIRRAEAEFERARGSLARIEPLNEDGAATDQELDDARAALRVAEADLAEARAQRTYTVLRAPFSGVVTERSAEPGDLAVPGRPVLTLVGTGGLEVGANLPAVLGGRIEVGDTLMVVHPETGGRIPVVVARVAPGLDSAARQFRVEARVPADASNHGLVSGAYVRLEVGDPARRTVWVPETAVVRRGQLTGVFAVESDTARLRWIRPGARGAASLEVLAGLTPEDAIVLDPSAGLEDGVPVRSASASAP